MNLFFFPFARDPNINSSFRTKTNFILYFKLINVSRYFSDIHSLMMIKIWLIESMLDETRRIGQGKGKKRIPLVDTVLYWTRFRWSQRNGRPVDTLFSNNIVIDPLLYNPFNHYNLPSVKDAFLKCKYYRCFLTAYVIICMIYMDMIHFALLVKIMIWTILKVSKHWTKQF